MKRALVWLAVLALAAACLPAAAEETPGARLFDLYTTNWAGDRWVASAIPIGDGVLLASWAVLPQEKKALIASDGEHRWEVKAVVPDEDGMTALVLFDEGAARKRRPDSLFRIMASGGSVPAADCTVRSRNAAGEDLEVRVLHAEACKWPGRECFLLTLEGDVPQGSPVVTGNGEVAGMIVAGYGEGPNRVLALTSEEIALAVFLDGRKVSAIQEWGDAPEGLSVQVTGNTAVIEWSAEALPETAEDETLYLIIGDAGNNFFSYLPVGEKAHKEECLLTPGRVYVAGFTVSREIPDRLPDGFTVFVPGPAEWMTDHGFRPKTTAIAEMPAAAVAGTTPIPVTEVTEELLRSGRAYFYSSSAYTMEAGMPFSEMNQSLLVTLTDPLGNNYTYESIWYFDRSLQEDDTWYVSLQKTGMTEFLDENGYPAGTYRLDYYIGGKLADVITFELK